jgi:hypothetical protein
METRTELPMLKKQSRPRSSSQTSTPGPANTPKEEGNLAAVLKQFININATISDLKSQIKELTIKSKEAESQILTIMNDHNLQNIDTQTNVIQVKTTTTKKAINQKALMEYFVSHLQVPPETIKTFVDQLPSKTVQTLCIKPK